MFDSCTFFFVTLEPRVEWYKGLKYEPASEPLHISVKWLFSLQARAKETRAFAGIFEAGALLLLCSLEPIIQ